MPTPEEIELVTVQKMAEHLRYAIQWRTPEAYHPKLKKMYDEVVEECGYEKACVSMLYLLHDGIVFGNWFWLTPQVRPHP